MESVGFLLYAAALALAELALVQSIAAGGIGVLAFASARLARRRLRRRELTGVLISIFGLVALGISLAGGSSDRRPGKHRVDPAVARCHCRGRDRGHLAGSKAGRGGSGIRDSRRAAVLDRRHLNETGHRGRCASRLRHPADPRVHRRHRAAANWLPGRRRAHRRRYRDAANKCATHRRRHHRPGRSGAARRPRWFHGSSPSSP